MNSIRRRVIATGCATFIVLAAGAAALGQATMAAQPAVMPVSIAVGAAQQDTGQYRSSQHVFRVGQDYTLRADETVRDVMTVFGDVTLEGRVDTVNVIFGSVHVKRSAVVQGSLAVIGGSATIEQGAALERELVVLGGTLTAPPGFSSGDTQVIIGSPTLGNVLVGIVPWLTRGLLLGRLIVPELHWVWIVVGVVFLVYLLINALFDGPVKASARVIVDRPISTVLLGLLVLVLTVPAVAILAASVVGLAIVPFVLGALMVAGLVGKAGAARALGQTLVRQSSLDSRLQSLRSFVLGSAVILLAYMVPILGLATWALTSVLGVGAAAAMLRGALRREHPAQPGHAPVAPAPPVAPDRGGSGISEPEEPRVEAPAPVFAAAPPVSAAPPPGDFALFPRATFLDRVAAFTLDCLLVAVAVQILDLSRHDGSFALALLAYHVAFWAWKGTTIGGIVVGLHLVRAQGGELRFVDALVRGLSSIFSLIALGIGCFWMLQDPERQMWHDKIAGTVVVRVPRNLLLA